MTDEEKKAIELLKMDLACTIKANECGLATKGEYDNEIKAYNIVFNLIEKQQNKIKQQADLLRQANFIIECDEKTHDYDVKIIDEVKGRSVKYYEVIEDMAKELTNFLEETEEDIIKQFTRGRGL